MICKLLLRMFQEGYLGIFEVNQQFYLFFLIMTLSVRQSLTSNQISYLTITQLFVEKTIIPLFNTRIQLAFLGNEFFNLSGHPRRIMVVANVSFMWYIVIQNISDSVRKMHTWASTSVLRKAFSQSKRLILEYDRHLFACEQ